MKHRCHWPDCTTPVPPSMWGCKLHWFKLPKELRDEIWRTYRAGQESDRRVSKEYIAAALKARHYALDQIGKANAEASK